MQLIYQDILCKIKLHLNPPAPWSLYSVALLVLKVAVAFPCPHLTSSAICLHVEVGVCLQTGKNSTSCDSYSTAVDVLPHSL